MGRSEEACAALARAGATARQVSLFERDQLFAAVAGHDTIVNLATHIPRSMTAILLPGNWRENDRVRRLGSANLVDAAIAGGATRLIQESFAPIYAARGDAWIDESWTVEPARYSKSVVDAERSAQRFSASGGAGIVLRFAAFYGPDASQFADLVRMIRHGWGPVPGAPSAFFSSVAHDDAASAVVAALDIPAGTYNVSDDQPLRHRELVDAIADAVGVPHPRLLPSWTAALGGSLTRMLARSQRISNRKLRSASAWAPRFPSMREGLPSAIAGGEQRHWVFRPS